VVEEQVAKYRKLKKIRTLKMSEVRVRSATLARYQHIEPLADAFTGVLLKLE
jgi:hypothetical protein